MTNREMYELLKKKSKNIKMHMDPEDVAAIAQSFAEATGIAKEQEESVLDQIVGVYNKGYSYRVCGELVEKILERAGLVKEW